MELANNNKAIYQIKRVLAEKVIKCLLKNVKMVQKEKEIEEEHNKRKL